MRIRLFSLSVLGASLCAVLLPVEAQKAPDQGDTTFRTETRQVLVDVVVRDRSGQFVPNLKPDAFTILEDGKPQAIVTMTMHARPATPPAPAPPLKLPPNQYTNYTVADPDRPITLVLMDLLNTQTLDQQYARKQMIEFLRALPPGQRVGLFVLGTRLKMLQGFTGDSDTLVAAAKMLDPSRSLLVTPESEKQDMEITAANLDANSSSHGAISMPGSSPSPSMAGAIANALSGQQDYQGVQRMGLTLAALASLARSVSAYPGRKNLLWLTAEIPLRLGPDFQLSEQATQQASGNSQAANHNAGLQRQASPLQETAALLTASQIAVYPIDIRGSVAPDTNLSNPTMVGGPGASSSMRDRFHRRQTLAKWNDEEGMTDIARETGGKASMGTNDLKGALTQSTQDGDSYYTIAYVPRNHQWNGKYRKIEVKCSTPAKLTYRRGYYAVADTFGNANAKGVEDEVAYLFATSMHPEAPTSTAVLLKVQVLPPDATYGAVRIDYAINPRDVIFVGNQDNTRQLSLDLMAVAWDKNGKDAGHSSDSINSSVSAKAYEDVMRSFIPAHQELQLKPGTYTLRLGVVDRNSRKIGTLDVPLTVPAPSPAK